MSDAHTHEAHEDQQPAAQHGSHGWMMIACCIPMVLIAVVLVATGVIGPGFIFVAVACTAMMWLMMRAMSGGETHDH